MIAGADTITFNCENLDMTLCSRIIDSRNENLGNSSMFNEANHTVLDHEVLSC